MTIELNDAVPTDIQHGIVRVTLLAGDNLTLDHVEETTVEEYLQQANIEIGHGQVVTVNGAPAQLTDTVEPDSVVIVAGKVING